MKKRSVVSVKGLVAACCAFCLVGVAAGSAWAWVSNCYEGIVQDHRKKAEQGNANSAFVLGIFYLQAECGLPQDIDLAVEWLRRAAELGSEGAKNLLEELGVK